MTEPLIRLIWNVDTRGYKIAKLPRYDLNSSNLIGAGALDDDHYGHDGDRIVPLGGKQRQYEARLLEHEIFRDLANSARRSRDDGVLEFVEKWGLPIVSRNPPLETFLKHRTSIEEALSCPPKEIARLRGLAEGAAQPDNFAVTWARCGDEMARALHRLSGRVAIALAGNS